MGTSKNEIPLDSSNYFIPVSVLCDRKLALFETMVEYLKDMKGLTYHEIAVITNRDDRLFGLYIIEQKRRETVLELNRKKILMVWMAVTVNETKPLSFYACNNCAEFYVCFFFRIFI